VRSGSYGLVGFLRGLLTNLGTPPHTSDIRSILVRPLGWVCIGPVSVCGHIYYSANRVAVNWPESRIQVRGRVAVRRSETGLSLPCEFCGERTGRGRGESAATEGTVDVALGFLLFDRLAFVVGFLAPGDGDFHLSDAVLEVDRKRDQSHSLLGCF
jgi:hypothetical protein